MSLLTQSPTSRRWFLDQLFSLSEQKTPRFAFLGTISWMHALSILVNQGEFESSNLAIKYSHVKRRNPSNIEAEIKALEYFYMALHNLATVRSFVTDSSNPYNVVRSAIVAWYYTIYDAASAMCLAASGSNSETHAKTARIWQADIVDNNLLLSPFDLSIKDLTKTNAEEVMLGLTQGNSYLLHHVPTSVIDAKGAIYSYLNGTVKYKQVELTEEVRDSKEFTALNKTDFRSKVAKELRDKRLKDKGLVNFLVQAFRYRGKAHYRDSIYLSYGDNNTVKLKSFLEDLNIVAAMFTKMASYFIAARISKQTWSEFVKDIQHNSHFDIDMNLLADK